MEPEPDEIRAIPVRHVGRYIAAALIGLAAATIIWSVATNPRFEWSIVGQYFLSSQVLHGLEITLFLTVSSMVIGIVLGALLAVMRLSPNPLVSGSSAFYVWVLRGTPILVQIIIWNNISALYPQLSLAGLTLNANVLISPITAGVLALGLNEGAYMAEIVRAGILSVDSGQTEAASALGMTRLQTLRRVILPQAMRVITPPTGNEIISMLKTTSLVSVIAVTDLLFSVQQIYSVNYRIIPLLIVASLWYLIVTTILSFGQYYIERHFGRGSVRELPLTPLQRIRRSLSFGHASARSRAAGDGQ